MSVWRVTAMSWRLQGTVSVTEYQMCGMDVVYVSVSPCQRLWSRFSEVSRSGGPHSSLWAVDQDAALTHSPGQSEFNVCRLILMSSGLDTTI